jgi:hypothetical protein
MMHHLCLGVLVSTLVLAVVSSTSVVEESLASSGSSNAYWAMTCLPPSGSCDYYTTLIYENGTIDASNTFPHISEVNLADTTEFYYAQRRYLTSAFVESKFFVTDTLTKGKQQYVVTGTSFSFLLAVMPKGSFVISN